MTAQIQNKNSLAIFAVLGASVLFASGGASRAIVGFPGTGISFAAWRVFIGAVGLLIYSRYKFGDRGLKVLFKQPIMWLMGGSILFYQASFFFGAGRIGIAIGTLVALGSAPLLAGLISWWMGLGKPTIQWAISTALGIFGLGLLTSTSGSADALGLLFVALSGWAYSILTVFGVKVVKEHNVSGIEVLTVAFAVGAIYSIPILATTSSWLVEPKAIGAVLWAGVAAATLAYALFGIGISHLSAGTVSTLTLFEPVTATTLGVLLLNETMNTRGWVGCVVIIVALGLVGYFESKSKPAQITFDA